MQIARMHPDGSQVEQITFDNFRNWTPHPSPDGKSIVFISYDPSVTTHAPTKTSLSASSPPAITRSAPSSIWSAATAP